MTNKTEILYKRTVSEKGKVKYVPVRLEYDADSLGEGWHLVGVGDDWGCRFSDVTPDHAAMRAAFEEMVNEAGRDEDLIDCYTKPANEPLTPRQMELWKELQQMDKGRFLIVKSSFKDFARGFWDKILMAGVKP